MDPRISTVESDVASVRASVEAMHSNYATNIALVEAEGRLQLEIVSTKNDLGLQIKDAHDSLNIKIIESRNELHRRIDQVAAELKLEFNKVAGDTRNWMLATAIGIFVTLGGLLFGFAKFLQP